MKNRSRVKDEMLMKGKKWEIEVDRRKYCFDNREYIYE